MREYIIYVRSTKSRTHGGPFWTEYNEHKQKSYRHAAIIYAAACI